MRIESPGAATTRDWFLRFVQFVFPELSIVFRDAPICVAAVSTFSLLSHRDQGICPWNFWF